MTIIYCDGRDHCFDRKEVSFEVLRRVGKDEYLYFCEDCFCDLVARITEGTETIDYELNTTGLNWSSMKELVELEAL